MAYHDNFWNRVISKRILYKIYDILKYFDH